jgi:hypothetical protein
MLQTHAVFSRIRLLRELAYHVGLGFGLLPQEYISGIRLQVVMFDIPMNREESRIFGCGNALSKYPKQWVHLKCPSS